MAVPLRVGVALRVRGVEMHVPVQTLAMAVLGIRQREGPLTEIGI